MSPASTLFAVFAVAVIVAFVGWSVAGLSMAFLGVCMLASAVITTLVSVLSIGLFAGLCLCGVLVVAASILNEVLTTGEARDESTAAEHPRGPWWPSAMKLFMSIEYRMLVFMLGGIFTIFPMAQWLGSWAGVGMFGFVVAVMVPAFLLSSPKAEVPHERACRNGSRTT